MTPIILDCDTGADDALALMLAARCPDLQLLGVTTVYGNAPVEQCTENTRAVLHACGYGDVPVYMGASAPLVRPVAFDDVFCGKNGVCEYPFAPSPAAMQQEDAVSFLCRMAQTHDALTIVSTAPMTNLAKTVSQLGPLAARLTVVTMAGYFCLGDVSRTSCSWNIAIDPEAYKQVVDSPVRLITLGADVTSQLRDEMVVQLLTHSQTDSAHFLRHCSDFYLARDLTPLSLLVDALPVAYLIEPGIAQFYTGDITVSLDTPMRADSVRFTRNACATRKVAHHIDTTAYQTLLKGWLF